MQMLLPESYSSGSLGSDQQPPFYSNQSSTDLPPAPIYSLKDDQSLTASSDNKKASSRQQSSPEFKYCPHRDDIKLEPPRISDQPIVGSEHLMNCDASPATYTPNTLDPSSAPTFLRHDEGLPVVSPQYGVLSSATMVSAPFPDTRHHVARHEQQSNFDILLPNQRGGKRGPFKDPSLREQTAQTRKMGSCIRCRMQRIRVRTPFL